MTIQIQRLKSFKHPVKAAVFGASGGIGQAFVSHLKEAENVSQIYTFSRNAAAETSDKALNFFLDFGDEAGLKQAAEQIKEEGGLDLILVSTGILHDGEVQPEKSLKDFNAQNFSRLFAVNTTGPALMAKHFLPLLPRDGRGVFAALSARVSSISDNRLGGWTAYRASKAALNMVIKNAAIEMGRRYKEAVIVGLHPGTVDTELSRPFQSNVPEGKLFTTEYSAAQMLGVIDGLSPADSGKLFAWDGQEISP